VVGTEASIGKVAESICIDIFGAIGAQVWSAFSKSLVSLDLMMVLFFTRASAHVMH
jgi:hypothetical protein